ncbi:MFS transporter [Chromatiales bacterium (ex Bugula neritina AB1)]|nr:MFS transporter [Chromatiales bacterium (ex Bugula neritina AB1)]
MTAIAYGIHVLLHPRAIVMLFLGFSAGVPILLIFSSLSLWLGEAGVKKSAVTYFSWAALGYSFKFVWAPLIDKLPIPGLTGLLGRRRSWLLLSQFAVIGAILWMAMTDPALGQGSLTMMAFAAVALGFSSATQDIVIDAFRIESAGPELQALLSSTYIAGYRIGMIVAGAGALYLASQFGSTKEVYDYSAWMNTYAIMAAVMLIGVATTFIVNEPDNPRSDPDQYQASDYLRFLLVFLISVIAFIAIFKLSSGMASSLKATLTEAFNNRHLAGFLVATIRLACAAAAAWFVALALVGAGVGNRQMIEESYVDPIRDFFQRYGLAAALLLLALVGLYRVSDIVMGVIANVFYQDLGYTKIQIASVAKVFGLLMTIAGGFLGGFLAMRFGVLRILFLGAVLSALTNLLFIVLASAEPSMPMLYSVIGADNLSAGLASAAFIAFLSSLTNISFTAVQYAIFSSLMTLFPKILGGYSGSMVESMGYATFFTITALLTVPVLFLIYLARGRFNDTIVIRPTA